MFTLAVPTVLSSLVMVLYNLADTYFVGMLQDPVQNSAVMKMGSSTMFRAQPLMVPMLAWRVAPSARTR
mgnify:CR=1 FL=1